MSERCDCCGGDDAYEFMPDLWVCARAECQSWATRIERDEADAEYEQELYALNQRYVR